MSRFRRLTQTIWHCQYHIVWVPKYRFRILSGKVATEVDNCIRAFSDQKECEIIELNIQIDHVHLLVNIPPKLSVSKLVRVLKGRSAISIFNKFLHLRKKPFWGYHFLVKGYYVDTVEVSSEMTR